MVTTQLASVIWGEIFYGGWPRFLCGLNMKSSQTQHVDQDDIEEYRIDVLDDINIFLRSSMLHHSCTKHMI